MKEMHLSHIKVFILEMIMTSEHGVRKNLEERKGHIRWNIIYTHIQLSVILMFELFLQGDEKVYSWNLLSEPLLIAITQDRF